MRQAAQAGHAQSATSLCCAILALASLQLLSSACKLWQLGLVRCAPLKSPADTFDLLPGMLLNVTCMPTGRQHTAHPVSSILQPPRHASLIAWVHTCRYQTHCQSTIIELITTARHLQACSLLTAHKPVGHKAGGSKPHCSWLAPSPAMAMLSSLGTLFWLMQSACHSEACSVPGACRLELHCKLWDHKLYFASPSLKLSPCLDGLPIC